MAGFIERMERLSVAARSPDQSIRARYSVRQGVVVECAPGFREAHTDHSLAEQIIAVVRAVFDGAHQATQTVMTELRNGSSPQPPRTSGAVTRKTKLAEAVDRIDESSVSPRGYVRARMHGGGDLDLKIRPGTVDRVDLSSHQLESEINAALAMVLDQYHTRRAEIHRLIY